MFFFVWNFDGIDIDFIWFFWGGILMELIWILYVFLYGTCGIDMDFIWFFCMEF